MFRNKFWSNKIKLVFHTPLDIIIRNNCQRSNESFAFQINFHLWDKLLDAFLKPTSVDVVDKWNLPWMRIEMKSWTCFGQGKSKNSDSVICTIVSNHLPSIVNNTNSSLVVMKPRTKPNFWIVDFEQQALQ